MDRSLFGMPRRPFRCAVDTGAYFPGETHELAAKALSAALDRRDRAVLLDGPPGTGKSLVARRWLEQLPPEIPRVVLANTVGTRPADLLQAILFDLNQNYEGMTEQELRLSVTAQLLGAAASGHPLIALIDEAQNVSHAALEELRLLGNIEVGGGPALFAVLVALPSLRDSLCRPAFEPIAQRIETRCRVEPLSADESAEYVRHQVQAAGGDPWELLEDEAIALLVPACDGLPRLLNAAAGLALELAAESGSRSVDAEAVLEALQRLGRPKDLVGEPFVLAHPAAAAAEEKPLPAKGAASRPSKQKSARKQSA